MIPQYSKKQILASYDEPIDTNVLWLDLRRDLEIKVPILKYFNGQEWIALSVFGDISHIELIDKNEENEFQHITQNQKDKLNNLENYIHPVKHPTSILNGVDTISGATDKYLNERGNFTKPSNSYSHSGLTDKNAEPEYQHITQEQKASLHTHTNKASLDNYNPALFATASQGEKADSALQSLPPNIVVDEDYSALKDKVNGIEENANNYEHPIKHPTSILEGVSSIGSPLNYLNEKGDFTVPAIRHSDLMSKNTEFKYQHVDTTVTKPVLSSNDKVTIYDSLTGKIVLTYKTNIDIQSIEHDDTLNKNDNSDFLHITQAEKELIASTAIMANANNGYISDLEEDKADKATTLSGYGITDAYTKTEIDNKVSAVYKFKGSVNTYADLPATNQVVGDVYNVTDTGINYAWDGTEWDNIGGVDPLATSTNNGLMSKEDFSKLAGIETGAEVNNISDLNVTDLTDGGDTNLHYHSADRNRANHTGTQPASTISDFDTEVANNTTVSANTSARHTHNNKTVLDNTTASFTAAYQNKLDGIQEGAEANVNADWNASSGDAQILNKPTTISGYGITDSYTKNEIDTNFENHKTYSNVTYNDLLALISNNELVPNSSYRITNYTTTTAQAETQSAGHDFDIIVTALSTNKLSEVASCVRKAGDTYFANAKLEAWEIKYCIDNDTSRFAWADTLNGKGVIYYMKDEWGNECPYDFKNIQYQTRKGFKYFQWGYNYTFKRDSSLDTIIADIQYYGYVSDSIPSAWSSNTCWLRDNTITKVSVMYDSSGSVINYGGEITAVSNENYDVYTFSKSKTASEDFDVSLNGLLYYCYNNTIRPYFTTQEHKHQVLNRITFVGWNTAQNYPGLYCISNTFDNNCCDNMFGDMCEYNTFGVSFCYNTFGSLCYSNTFGNECQYNTFGDNCYSNSFGDYCSSNTFGVGCQYSTFGNAFRYNTFSGASNYNTFGNYCFNNTFGNECQYSTFGNYCSYNNFYHGNSGTTKKDYIKYIVLEDGCSYNNFYSTLTTSSSSFLQRIRIKGLQNTSATNTQITLSETNTNYEWLIYYTSSGVLKQHFLGYGLVNTTITKETLVEDDKVTIYDSETGEVVLTDKSNIIPSHNALSNRNGEDKFRHVDLLYTKQTLLENDKLVVWDSNTNEVTLAKKSSISHRDINYKNSETAFQHVDTTKEVEIFNKLVVLNAENELVLSSLENINKTEILYEDLFALWEAEVLLTGMQYLITDYQTTYLMPHTEEVIICDVEPLLVTATSNRTIAPIAYSPSYPNDIIYYDIDSERTYGDVLPELIQPGASKGYIFRRVDTLNKIDVGFDWRTVKFRRWGIDYEQIPIYVDNTEYQKGDLVRSYDGTTIYIAIKTGVLGYSGYLTTSFMPLCGSEDNILYTPNDIKLLPFQTNTLTGNTANYRDYSFIPKSATDGSLSDSIKNIQFSTNTSNIIYRSNTVIIKGTYTIKVGSDCYHNTIMGVNDNESYDFELADNCIGNIIGNIVACNISPSFTDNVIGAGFSFNNIGSHFQNNLIGYSFNNNKFGNDCHSNAFSSGCYSNEFGDKCDNNTFGSVCYYNKFGNGFDDNTFGNDCYSNSFGDKCNNNTLGNECQSNAFGTNCDYNAFGNICNNNTFDDECNNNEFGINCSNNTFGDNCYSNSFGDYFDSNTFGNDCFNNTFDTYCSHNKFGDNCESTTFGNNCFNNTVGNYCFNNTFGGNCQSNTFGNTFQSNTFGNSCNYNTFGDKSDNNTFGNSCSTNTFGTACSNNIFGNSFQSNTFGDKCSSNTSGDICTNNTFGIGCTNNTFGDNCQRNTFGNNCNSNTFGDTCYFNMICNVCEFNTFGNKCDNNTFGNRCSYNNFYAGTTGTVKKDYIKYVVLEDGCMNNNFYSSITTSSASSLQRIRIKGLENTTATDTQITLSATNTKYEWLVCYTSTGELKQYCPND